VNPELRPIVESTESKTENLEHVDAVPSGEYQTNEAYTENFEKRTKNVSHVVTPHSDTELPSA
jgi:hypothetical protein